MSLAPQAKREKDEAKNLRRRNTKRLTEILDRMTDIKYNTTWEQVDCFECISDVGYGTVFLKRLSGVGSEPGASRLHLFSHFHHLTAEPQQFPKGFGTVMYIRRCCLPKQGRNNYPCV
jgi:hypothetical protein